MVPTASSATSQREPAPSAFRYPTRSSDVRHRTPVSLTTTIPNQTTSSSSSPTEKLFHVADDQRGGVPLPIPAILRPLETVIERKGENHVRLLCRATDLQAVDMLARLGDRPECSPRV